VDTRSRMCHGGWEVWVHGIFPIICISELIIVRSMVSYYVCCINYMYIYINLSYTCTVCNNIQEYVVRDSSVGIATRYGLDGPGIEP